MLVPKQASLNSVSKWLTSIIAIFILHTQEKFLEDTKTCIYNARHFVREVQILYNLQKTMNIQDSQEINSFDSYNVHFKNKIACKQILKKKSAIKQTLMYNKDLKDKNTRC